MVRPKTFRFDEQTAESNSFQNRLALPSKQISKQVGQEFDGVVNGLRDNGVGVIVFDDPDAHDKPNAVFPNNWVTTWNKDNKGLVCLYPMEAETRRAERSEVLIDQLKASHNISSVIDLSPNEQLGKYLEGTGVFVPDREDKVLYACLSSRCNESLLREHADQLGYEPVIFHAYGPDGEPFYHTNVMMGGIGKDSVVICSEAIPDPTERGMVLERLRGKFGEKVVDISQWQTKNFCGNTLELRNTDGDRLLTMSDSAFWAFTPEQREILGDGKKLAHFPIPTIEKIGGGSVRCMQAEIFLSKKLINPTSLS